MERSGPQHEVSAEYPQAPAAPGPYDLALLGRSSAPRQTPLHSESPEAPSRPRGPITTGNVLRLLECQQYRCALTGRALTPDTASLDHIVPVRSGGEHVVENTQVLHREVNRAKSTMTNEECVQLCREVVRHTSAQLDCQPPVEASGIGQVSQDKQSQLIDWFAEGQAVAVEFEGVVMTVRYVCRKGRRARIAITGPAGAVFSALDSSEAARSPDRST